MRVGVKDSTEILFLSWLVNCLVPAKLGDLYRAYLLKINADVSARRTFGTMFIERILDLFAIAILGLAAGFWSFRSGFPPEIQFVAVLGIGVIVVLAGLPVRRCATSAARSSGKLPLPDRVARVLRPVRGGRVRCDQPADRSGPLAILTVMIWVTEGLRLWLVIQALGLPGRLDRDLRRVLRRLHRVAAHRRPAQPGRPRHRSSSGWSGCSRSPTGCRTQEATTIVLVDRLISVFSIIVIGSILYLVSPIRRGAGLAQPVEAGAPAA